MRRRRTLLVLGALALVVVVAGGALLVARPWGRPGATARPVVVRWFVGLGTGTQPTAVDVWKPAVVRFNKSHSDIQIKLEIVPSAIASDTLKAEMASGNAPDIIGPVGVGGRNSFYGTLADLTPLASKHKFDLTQFPPAMLADLKQGGALVSLPYAIYPSFMLYNKDLFAKAGLPDLPTHIGDLYMGKTWDWAEAKAIGMRLTLDRNGHHPGDPEFDPDHIVQFGLDFQYWDGRRVASAFGDKAAQLVDPATVDDFPPKAQLSENFKAAWRYYYDGIWTSHFIPTGKYRASDLLNGGATFASGKVAMNGSNTWCLGGCYYGTVGKTNMTAIDFAVMPSYDGVTAGPLDLDGFSVTKMSKHPDEAFQAMLAIMADPELLSTYGAMPAAVSMRQAWEAGKTAEAKSYFSGVDTLSWDAVDEMAAHPANPSQEGYLPNYTKSVTDYGTAFTNLQDAAGLNVDKVLADLQTTLQTDFDAYAAPRVGLGP